MPHLYDNATFGFAAVGTSAGYTIGNPFVVTDTITVSQLGFYRDDTGAQTHPTHLAIYETNAGTLVAPDTAPAVPAGIGWQWTDLASPVVLPAGTYIVVGYWPAGYTWYRNTSAPRPIAPANIDWPTYNRADHQGATMVYPTESRDNFCQNAVDITYTVGGSTPPPPDTDQISYLQLREEMARWLASADATNTHHGDLPWLTSENVLSVLSKIGNVSSQEQTQYGISGNNLWRGLIALLGYVVANGQNLQALIGTANQIKNWLGGNGGAAAEYDYHGAVEDIRQKVYNVESLLSPGGAIRNGIDWQTGAIYDEARLSVPDTYALNGYGYLVTSRTVHRISVGTIPPEVGQIDFTGDNVWLPRFGWWAPITAQGAVLERHYIDWKEQWLVPAPQTCVGLAYHLPTGVDATLYAYSVL